MGQTPIAGLRLLPRHDVFRLGDLNAVQVEQLQATLFVSDALTADARYAVSRAPAVYTTSWWRSRPTGSGAHARILTAVAIVWIAVGLPLWCAAALPVIIAVVGVLPLVACLLAWSYHMTWHVSSTTTKAHTRGVHRARGLLLRAKAGDPEVRGVEVHVGNSNAGHLDCELPTARAAWRAPLEPGSHAVQFVASLPGTRFSGAVEATQLVLRRSQWVAAWQAQEDTACAVAGEDSAEAVLLRSCMTTLAEALAPYGPLDTKPPAVAAHIRRRCNEAVREYCQLTPAQAARVRPGGQSATDGLISVLQDACATAR